MRLVRRLCCSVLLLAPPLCASTLGPEPTDANVSIFRRYQAVEPTLRKAVQEFQARQFEETRKDLGICLQQVPDHFEAHFLLAQMDYDGRQYAKALDHVETAERALAGLKRAYAQATKEALAKDEAQKRAIEDSLAELTAQGVTEQSCMGTVVGEYKQHLAQLEAKKGDLFERKNPFSIPAEYRFLHGTCLYRLNRLDESAFQYKLALQTDPSYAKAWNNLINIYWLQKDGARARESLSGAEAKGVVIQPRLKEAVLALPQEHP